MESKRLLREKKNKKQWNNISLTWNWTKAKWLKWIIHSFNQNLLSSKTYFNEKWKTSVQPKIYKQFYNNTFLKKGPSQQNVQVPGMTRTTCGNSQPCFLLTNTTNTALLPFCSAEYQPCSFFSSFCSIRHFNRIC